MESQDQTVSKNSMESRSQTNRGWFVKKFTLYTLLIKPHLYLLIICLNSQVDVSLQIKNPDKQRKKADVDKKHREKEKKLFCELRELLGCSNTQVSSIKRKINWYTELKEIFVANQ